MNQSRRDFLRRMGVGAGSAAMLSAIESFSLTNAMAQGTGYRALVCVFLAGGNDGNNVLIPLETGQYNDYFAARNPSQLAVTSSFGIQPISIGQNFMMHPSTGPLYNLWNQGKLIFVPNVGPLVRPLVSPTPRQAYTSNPTWRPTQLFSHSDQVAQWQSADPKGGATTGWGGRTADQFTPHPSAFPMITSIAGNARFTIGQLRRPLTIATANQPPAAPNLNNILALSGFSGDPQGTSRRAAMDFLRTIDNGPTLRATASGLMDQALLVDAALRTANVALTTVFPNTNLGNQLLQVARVMKANQTQPALGLTHQIFFVSIGGFDTHKNQNNPGLANSQVSLLTQVSNAMNAFYNATVELGIEQRVTTFTLTDFNRTLNPAGTGVNLVGSDHAWGNHAWVMGGSVRGYDFYGVPGPGGTSFPLLRMGSVYGTNAVQDTDTRGRWIPSTSIDQYANTLAKWFGLPQTDTVLRAVFPYLLPNGPNPGFTPLDLGFLDPLT